MITEANDSNISAAADALRAGKLVAFPTETVYGLGANALNAEAVHRIFQVKGRPVSNPLIVHVADLDDLSQVVTLDSKLEERLALAAQFFPGPLSVVLPRGSRLPDIVSGGRDSVAVRVPDHPVALKLLREAAVPVAAPSANRSDYISPTTAQHVQDCLGSRVDLILDGGRCSVGIESTVLSLVDETPLILRPGGVTREALEEVFGVVGTLSEHTSPTHSSPGLLAKHYSPRCPVRFCTEVESSKYPDRVGLLRFNKEFVAEDTDRFVAVRTLSSDSSLCGAASELYSALRELDAEKLDLILIERCSLSGIGVAIMDRLTRATG